MKRWLLACITMLCCSLSNAQLLTWTPAFPVENDPNQTLTITVDATKGNQGLLNFSGNVYVHIGVITNLSANPGDWRHTLFTWGTKTAAALDSSAGTNK